jgi:hypothetical protein
MRNNLLYCDFRSVIVSSNQTQINYEKAIYFLLWLLLGFTGFFPKIKDSILKKGIR